MHSKECQLWQFLLYAHLINVLSLAAVNHIIQTPVPAPLNELCTVDVFLNVSPISTLDPPTPMSRNAQQGPASEVIDIEVPLLLPPLHEVHLPATRVPETMLDLSSQAEVEAIMNSTHPGGLSSMGPVPEGVTLASTDTCHHSKRELVQIDHGRGGVAPGNFCCRECSVPQPRVDLPRPGKQDGMSLEVSVRNGGAERTDTDSCSQ